MFLTAREHFIIHLLLTKIYTGNDRYKMIYALQRMMHITRNVKLTSAQYDLSRKIHSEGLKGEGNPSFGRKRSLESRLKQSLSRKGKYAGKDNSFYGKSHSNETREIISKANRGKVISESHRKIVSAASKKRHAENRKRVISDG